MKITAVFILIFLLTAFKSEERSAIAGKYVADHGRTTMVLKKNGDLRINLHIELNIGEPGEWKMKGDTVFLDFRDSSLGDLKYRWNGKDSLNSIGGTTNFARVKQK